MRLKLGDGRELGLDRPVLMGILNVTPDSFSDGGLYGDVDSAVAHGVAMAREGAGVIDVGGESTRPGAARIPAAEQIERTQPVIERLVAALDEAGLSAWVSIDTTLASVAAAGLDAGAVMVNDVSAGREDEGLLPLVASRGAAVVLMHMQGEPGTMQDAPSYGNVVSEVRNFLLQRSEAARAAGIGLERIMIDPGIGFGKTVEHNIQLLAHLKQLVSTGYPVLLGTSRKRSLRAIVSERMAGRQAGPVAMPAAGEMDAATGATTALGVWAGVQAFRVHDVRINRQAADIAWRIREAIGSLPC